MPNAPSPTTVNFGSLIAPDVAAQQIQLQRQQQIADFLRQQAMAPVDQQVVTGAGPSRVVPISPFQGLAKMASAYLSGKSQDAIDEKNIGLSREMAQRYAQVLGGGAPIADPSTASPVALAQGATQGSVGPTVANAQRMDSLTTPQPAPTGGNNFDMGKLLRGSVVEQLGGAPAASAYWKQYEPTDLSRALRESGVDPASAQGRAVIQANIEKQNYIAPVNARPGSIIRDARDPSHVLAFNPHMPEGGTPQFDQQGNVTGIGAIPGATDVMQAAARARAAGEGSVQPYAGVDAQGNPLPVTNRTAVATQGMPAPAAPMPPAAVPPSAPMPVAPAGVPASGPAPMLNQSQFNATPLARAQAVAVADPSILQGELAKAQARLTAAQTPDDQLRAQNDIAGLQREMARGKVPAQGAPGAVYAAPPMGATTGKEAAQTELSKKWTDLNAANAQAQTTSSYLENIKQLAAKAATGPFTDKIQFANALLSQVGGERATDATTANALLDKYSNQIVTRLGGSGGLGTDSARSLLQSAYPNAHMTLDAINEAADNLKGANDMIKAKTALLQPHAAGRDPVAYSQREVLFDQNADPRLWQLKNMDAAAAKKYLSALPPNVQADLRQRAAALKQAGAF